MLIKELALRQFRNYKQLKLTPHPGVNLLFGQNGAGKTNLIEGIHYCALGRSHRTSQDREVVQKGQAFAVCEVKVQKGGVTEEISVRLTPDEARKKQVFIGKKRAARLSELMGLLQCVVFSPEDLELVKGGPGERRRFADMLISQLSPAYFLSLQQYQRALEQRNALLRECRRESDISKGVFEAFEMKMAEALAVIVPKRRLILSRLNELAAEKYRNISGKDSEAFQALYQCCLREDGNIAEAAAERWKNARGEDVFRASTGFGCHREEIRLTLNGREMKTFASQGQMRTAALSLKMAQLALYEEKTGEMPVLLLDDVMSELDMNRRTQLLRELKNVQTFVTCTDESDLQGCENRRVYQVAAGEDACAAVTETSEGEAAAETDGEKDPIFL